MRFLIRARTPTDSGNKVVQDPNFLTKLEAAYFMPIEGHRAGAFIVNVESNEQIPAIVEPLFQCGAPMLMWFL